MGNSKETICGELLYEFMVHEKGFKISGRWNNHEQKKLQFKIEFVPVIFDYDPDGSCLLTIRMVQFNYLNAEIIRLHRQEVI